MNEEPEPAEREEEPELMTIKEIEERFEITRQAVHRFRVMGIFPLPVFSPGSTRMKFEAAAVEAFFAANPKRPGRRTDLERKAAAKKDETTEVDSTNRTTDETNE